MLDVLLILVFAAHLLAVNIATGAPFLALWCESCETRRGDALAGRLGRDLARLSNAALGVGTALGGLTLFLLWKLRPEYSDALLRIPGFATWLGMSSRIWFGLAELVIFALSMWAYRLLWDWLDFRHASHRWAHRALGWFAGLNILYHFPPLFAVAAVLNERPELAAQKLRYWDLLFDAEVAARVLHSSLAAFAISGVAVMAWAMRRAQKHPEDSRRVAVWGARMALVPTALQLLAGTWLTFQLPESTRLDLMGGDWLGTTCFALAVGASIFLMHTLAGVAMGDLGTGAMARSLGLAALVVLLMVTVRHRAREGRASARGAYLPQSREGDNYPNWMGFSPGPSPPGPVWFVRRDSLSGGKENDTTHIIMRLRPLRLNHPSTCRGLRLEWDCSEPRHAPPHDVSQRADSREHTARGPTWLHLAGG